MSQGAYPVNSDPDLSFIEFGSSFSAKKNEHFGNPSRRWTINWDWNGNFAYLCLYIYIYVYRIILGFMLLEQCRRRKKDFGQDLPVVVR